MITNGMWFVYNYKNLQSVSVIYFTGRGKEKEAYMN
jgi:hypothetical protein